MKFKNPFNRFFSKSQTAPESAGPTATSSAEASASATEAATGWDELAKLNPDTSATTFDDLAAVPFAGDASVTDSAVTLATPVLLTQQ